MGGSGLIQKLKAAAMKYRFVILILLLGIVFMSIPVSSEHKQEAKPKALQQESPSADIQTALSRILSTLEGAGRVEVLLTQSAGEELLYQGDIDEAASGDGTDTRTNTVIVTDSDRGQHAVVRQIIPPRYQGAVVLCQGGDRPEIRLAIVEAVANATGLSTDKISVLKMK